MFLPLCPPFRLSPSNVFVVEVTLLSVHHFMSFSDQVALSDSAISCQTSLPPVLFCSPSTSVEAASETSESSLPVFDLYNCSWPPGQEQFLSGNYVAESCEVGEWFTIVSTMALDHVVADASLVCDDLSAANETVHFLSLF